VGKKIRDRTCMWANSIEQVSEGLKWVEGKAAARTFGLLLHVLNSITERELDAVFATDQLRSEGS
jgi:hypothetical protein